jgi:hypothetical protein
MKPCRRHRFMPTLLTLEDRCLPAAAVLTASLLSDGTLRIYGTDNADTIFVKQIDNQVSVQGLSVTAAGKLAPSLNVLNVKKIEVYGYGGNDVVNLEAVNIPSMVFGGDGDDIIIGSQANDYLFGGNGNDKIWGRGGNDKLYGEAGNDWLYGENGNDYLNGGTGRDQFFGRNANSPVTDFDLYHDEFDFTKPIQDGASASDVLQGRANNCQTLAALAAIAYERGTTFIQSAIKYQGNYNYQVYLPGESRSVTVTFDGTWSDTDARPSGLAMLDQGEFWTLVMNRARLSTFGVKCLAQYSDTRWDELNQASGYRLKSIQNAFFQFTGQYSVAADSSHLTFDYLSWSLDNKDLVAAASYTSAQSGINSAGIVANHAYAVTRAFTVNGAQYVELYNPWGTDSLGSLTVDKAPGTVQVNNGFITLPWLTYLANISQTVVV